MRTLMVILCAFVLVGCVPYSVKTTERVNSDCILTNEIVEIMVLANGSVFAKQGERFVNGTLNGSMLHFQGCQHEVELRFGGEQK